MVLLNTSLEKITVKRVTGFMKGLGLVWESGLGSVMWSLDMVLNGRQGFVIFWGCRGK